VALTQALATLPERQRRAVILHYLADLPISEVARQEGVGENTVKSWLYRGRTGLAAQLTENLDGNLDGKESRRA
jgi:RNA polymerase sigma-70 factor (ECF subfamily)